MAPWRIVGHRRPAEGGVSGEMCGSQVTSPGRDPERGKCFRQVEGDAEGRGSLSCSQCGGHHSAGGSLTSTRALRNQGGGGALSGRV